MIDLSTCDLLSIIGADTHLRKSSGYNGGEYVGACPDCGGKDRFTVYPRPMKGNPWFICRKCDFSGDALVYVQDKYSLDFRGASEWLRVELPKQPQQPRPQLHRPHGDVNPARQDYACFNAEWQTRARDFFEYASGMIYEECAASARGWLRARGLRPTGNFPLGFNPVDRWERWGSVDVYIPRGIVIPWYASGMYWNLRVRRRDVDVQAGAEKYVSVKGAANGLYNADSIQPGYTVVLTEGEFDAQILRPALPNRTRITVASIGSFTGARTIKWLALLATCRRVLLAFDADDAGDKAAAWWLDKLGAKARRLRPDGAKDATDMYKAGIDLSEWIAGALSWTEPASIIAPTPASDPPAGTTFPGMESALISGWRGKSTYDVGA